MKRGGTGGMLSPPPILCYAPDCRSHCVYSLPRWTGVASWHWIANDENCGICRMAFDGCCPDCRMPGDDCPLGNTCSWYYSQALHQANVIHAHIAHTL